MGLGDCMLIITQIARNSAMPDHAQMNVYATGLYGHSERGGALQLLSLIPGAVREGKTLLAMLGDLVRYAGVPR